MYASSASWLMCGMSPGKGQIACRDRLLQEIEMEDASSQKAEDLKTVQAFVELMNGWNTIMAAARKQFPTSSEDELFKIAKGAMDEAVGLKPSSCCSSVGSSAENGVQR